LLEKQSCVTVLSCTCITGIKRFFKGSVLCFRAEKKHQAEEDKRELLETAKKMAAEEIARLQGVFHCRQFI
jgi:hypothetical protein